MKLMQQQTVFSPVSIVLETREEAEALWNMARFTKCNGEMLSRDAKLVALQLSDWFSNEVKL